MSDDIMCCVEGCKILAEVEVERSGVTIWMCIDHWVLFFPLKLKPKPEAPPNIETREGSIPDGKSGRLAR